MKSSTCFSCRNLGILEQPRCYLPDFEICIRKFCNFTGGFSEFIGVFFIVEITGICKKKTIEEMQAISDHIA